MNNSIDKNNSIYKIRETYKLEWYWNGIIVKVPTRINIKDYIGKVILTNINENIARVKGHKYL